MIGKAYLLCKEMSPDIYHIPIEKDISVNSSMEDFIAESGRNGDECFCFCFAELFASLGAHVQECLSWLKGDQIF